jgi:hemolysin III
MQRSREEEVVNAVTHFLAAVITPVITFMAVMTATDTHAFIPLLLMGGTATWGFLSSFLYHSAKTTRANDKGFINDRAAIYIMIAGSGAGMCLAGNQSLEAVMISIAMFLVCFLLTAKLCLVHDNSETFTVLSCVLFGWLAVLPSVGLIMPTKFNHGAQLMLLLLGGLAYSIGVIFYVRDKPWCHAAWHIFVVLGFGLHITGCYMCLI